MLDVSSSPSSRRRPATLHARCCPCPTERRASTIAYRIDVIDVDGVYALAQATGPLPDYDKCQAYIADVHSTFRSGS
ncbi:MAG TPA: hypothetical protein VK594_12745 [Streptosporangiaceae bacterium]|nr:hypothetical protein [Streptosporangiaceae bacterium]